MLGLVLSLPLAIAAFLPLVGRRLTRVPLASWGMAIAHFGVAVALFGMASESAFTRERLAAVAIGGTERVAGWQVTLEGIDAVAGPNWTALETRILAQRGAGEPVRITPRSEEHTSELPSLMRISYAVFCL